MILVPYGKCRQIMKNKMFSILAFHLSVVPHSHHFRNLFYCRFFTSWIRIRILHSDPGGFPYCGSGTKTLPFKVIC